MKVVMRPCFADLIVGGPEKFSVLCVKESQSDGIVICLKIP